MDKIPPFKTRGWIINQLNGQLIKFVFSLVSRQHQSVEL